MINFLLFVSVFYGFLADNAEMEIVKKLENQSECWNNGNIDCFMEDYWHDDSLMYIGKNGVTYGWKNTLESYKLRYPTNKEMGQLIFEIIQIKRLNVDHFFMAGKWSLSREIGDISGHFTLIWKKIENNWVIISDHSS